MAETSEAATAVGERLARTAALLDDVATRLDAVEGPISTWAARRLDALRGREAAVRATLRRVAATNADRLTEADIDLAQIEVELAIVAARLDTDQDRSLDRHH